MAERARQMEQEMLERIADVEERRKLAEENRKHREQEEADEEFEKEQVRIIYMMRNRTRIAKCHKGWILYRKWCQHGVLYLFKSF